MNIQQLEARATAIRAAMSAQKAILDSYPRNAMNMVIEEVRVSPEYQRDKRTMDRLFAELRKVNTVLVKARKAA